MKNTKIYIYITAMVLVLFLGACNFKNVNEVTTSEEKILPTYSTETAPKETSIRHIDRGTISDIAGSDFAASIDEVEVKDAFDGRVLDVLFSEYIESGLIEKMEQLYFDENKIEKTSDAEYLYQVKVIIGNMEYILDFYVSEEGPFVCMNEQWETINCEDNIYEIIKTIHSFVIKPEETEDTKLSDAQVIEHFLNLIEESIERVSIKVVSGKLYLSSLQNKMDNWNSENPGIQSYIEMYITPEQLSQLLNEIELTYSDSSFSVASNIEIINAEFNIQAIYEGYELEITADDSSIYIKTWINGDNYRIKIENKDVYSTFINMIDNDIVEFDLNDIKNTEYITLHYVKDEDLKDFPNNKRMSEKKITNKDTVDKIVEAVTKNAVPYTTYPSRECADLVFHTPDGDIYFKVKNPITQDKNNLLPYSEEPTIIAEGYFWYECREVYEILMEYFKEH